MGYISDMSSEARPRSLPAVVAKAASLLGGVRVSLARGGLPPDWQGGGDGDRWEPRPPAG